MNIEIERKFLVLSDTWRLTCVKSVRLRDGLIASTDGRKVRIRVADGQAFVTIKGVRAGISRAEFEYPIPLDDAENLLANHCDGQIVTKTRHFVIVEGCTFEVDIYDGLLDGIVVAEVELSSPDQAFPRPPWLGEEITGKEEYRKINMLKERIRLANI